MPKFAMTRDMRFTAEETFSVAADVDSYKDFLPLVRESRTYERTRIGEHGESFMGAIRIRYKKLNIDQIMVSQVTIDREKRTIRSVGMDGPFEHMNSQWTFHDKKGGGCSVEFKIDYKLKSRALQLIVSGMFDMVNRKILSAFEGRADALYGNKGARSA